MSRWRPTNGNDLSLMSWATSPWTGHPERLCGGVDVDLSDAAVRLAGLNRSAQELERLLSRRAFELVVDSAEPTMKVTK